MKLGSGLFGTLVALALGWGLVEVLLRATKKHATSAPSSAPPSSGAQADKDRAARPAVLEGFKRHGIEPWPAGVQYVQAVGRLETNYGTWSFAGHTPNKNNWGAVQCPKDAPDEQCTGQTKDSNASGRTYDVRFKAYATPADGAADLVANVLVHRPRTMAALRADGATVFDASFAMRREHYYGGFCKDATAKYGAPAVDASFRTPDANDATRACQREAVTGHATSIAGYIHEIAAALGEPCALDLGDFDTAEQRYHAAEPRT